MDYRYFHWPLNNSEIGHFNENFYIAIAKDNYHM